MIECPIPIIACVDGVAAASGCQLVAASDMAICSNRSSFSTPGYEIYLIVYFYVLKTDIICNRYTLCKKNLP